METGQGELTGRRTLTGLRWATILTWESRKSGAKLKQDPSEPTSPAMEKDSLPGSAPSPPLEAALARAGPAAAAGLSAR